MTLLYSYSPTNIYLPKLSNQVRETDFHEPNTNMMSELSSAKETWVKSQLSELYAYYIDHPRQDIQS